VTRTLRDALQEASLRGAPPKRAWAELIRQLRQRKKDGGSASPLASRGAVDRALAQEFRGDAGPLHRALVGLAQGRDTLGECEAALLALLPVVASGSVRVRVTGWPRGFPLEDRARLLRLEFEPTSCDLGEGMVVDLAPGPAAALHAEFSDFVLGGSALRVEVDGPLPAVPRGLRARPMRRGRRGPWLPHVDEQGALFLTPRELAERQAVRVPPGPVIDAFAGCGGNAVVLARQRSVLAVEADPERAARCRANAAWAGVDLTVVVGCAERVVPSSWQPGAVVFLDPPWGGREAPTWETLLPEPGFRRWLRGVPVVLKAPREFDVGSLPGQGWSLHYEFGERPDDRSVVRMITAVRAVPGPLRRSGDSGT
jgi:hypothetical protein